MRTGARLVFPSTTSVYGSTREVIDECAREEPRPETPYAATKLLAERALDVDARASAVRQLSSRVAAGRRSPRAEPAQIPAANPVERVRALTGGRGVDYAFEAIGLPATMRQAYDCLAKRGVAVIVGVTPMATEVSVPVMSLVFEERVLTGSVYGSSRPRTDIPMLIDLYRAGKLKLEIIEVARG